MLKFEPERPRCQARSVGGLEALVLGDVDEVLDALDSVAVEAHRDNLGDGQVGTLTSAVRPAGRNAAVGLSYLKTRLLRPGLELRVGHGGDFTARVVKLPFALGTSERA